MATLRARNIGATFLLGPLAGTAGSATYVQFIKDGTVSLRSELVMTDDDVSELSTPPYMLMRGYRFVVKGGDLREFACELIADAKRRRLT